MPGLIRDMNTLAAHGYVVLRPGVLAVVLFVIFMPGMTDAISQAPAEGALSSSADCTEININYSIDGSLTREEAISRMDQAFYESLNRYDACQSSLSTSSSRASAASGSDGGQGATGQGADSGGTDGGAAGSAGPKSAVASPNLSGTDKPISDSSISAAAKTRGTINSKIEDRPQTRAKSGVIQTGSGKTPEDIPPADNDSVLEAQIRQAAMNETDPETREKLWREYRKYKGLPQPADPATMANEQ